jgi:CRP-like cAMP-binding protein
MATFLLRKLAQFTTLSPDEKAALEQATAERIRKLGPREDIIHEDDRPKHVNVILDGFACRYKVLQDGRRQIAAFLVPGDICDMAMFLLERMDHSIATLGPLTLAEVPTDTVLQLAEAHPQIARAFWWNTLVEEAIAREWVVNVGQRDATERTAHLLCELFVRLWAIGLVEDGACELPITQTELSDAMGLSVVHTNRTLQELRGRGLITLKGRTLVVHDFEVLRAVGLFNPNYLHIRRGPGRVLEAVGA